MNETDIETANGRAAFISVRTILLTLTGVVFIAIMGGGVAALHMRANAETPPDASPALRVAVKAVRFAESYTIKEHFTGRLEPARQTRLAFERPGLVRQLLFEEGQAVPAGAIIARLDMSKLEAERDRLFAQRAELEARHSLAAVTLKRQAALKSQGWQSHQKYDEARFNLAALAASIDRVDKAVKSIDVDIGKSVLKAPFAGRIASRFIDEGAVVSVGTPVVELLEADKRQVRVGISVEAARSLGNQESYRLRIGGRSFRGRLVSKRPDLKTGTRTVEVVFSFIGAPGGEDIPFGEIVELMLERRVMSRGAWLPMTALTEGRKGLWSVLTVPHGEGDGVIAREAVEVLHVDGARAFVRGTLGDGARIVVHGTNRIVPGQIVSAGTSEKKS